MLKFEIMSDTDNVVFNHDKSCMVVTQDKEEKRDFRFQLVMDKCAECNKVIEGEPSICPLCEEELCESCMSICITCGEPVCPSCVDICCGPRRSCIECGFTAPDEYILNQDSLFVSCDSCGYDYCTNVGGGKECDITIAKFKNGVCKNCYKKRSNRKGDGSVAGEEETKGNDHENVNSLVVQSIKTIAENLETPENLGLEIPAALRIHWEAILEEYRNYKSGWMYGLSFMINRHDEESSADSYVDTVLYRSLGAALARVNKYMMSFVKAYELEIPGETELPEELVSQMNQVHDVESIESSLDSSYDGIDGESLGVYSLISYEDDDYGIELNVHKYVANQM